MSSLQNGLRLLGLLDRGAQCLRVSEAARQLDLPKSTVSRLFKDFAATGLLEPDPTGGYRSGPEMFRLGSLYRARIPIEERVDSVCVDLVRRHPATAYVGVLRGADLLVLRRHEGSYPVRYILEPGESIPAFATALGKALLARLDHETLASLLPARLVHEARGVDATKTEMLAELKEAREQGFARLDDRFLGIAAWGVAVRLSPTREIGFAVCHGREALNGAAQAEIAEQLVSAAIEIGQLCQDAYWVDFVARPPAGH